MTANQAILYVRSKRPNSIQTRSQLSCVRQFVQFLAPLRSVFSCAEPRYKPVTLAQYLNRQRHILHGSERKELRHLPKIIQLVSKLLLDIVENREVIEEDILEAPDIHDIEMTISLIEQMGTQFFTKEPRLPGMPTLPRHFNEPPIFYHRKSLSYSESDLRRLGSQLNLLTQPLGSLSQDNVGKDSSPSKPALPAIQRQKDTSFVSQGSTSSLWKVKNEETQGDGSLLLKKIKRKSIQRSESVGNNEPAKKGNMLSRWKAEQRDELAMNGVKSKEDHRENSAVPFITLQSELSLEARRLLAAQALAVDLFIDGEEEHKSKVVAWQVSRRTPTARPWPRAGIRLCPGPAESRRGLGETLRGARSLHPHRTHVVVAGTAERARHLPPGSFSAQRRQRRCPECPQHPRQGQRSNVFRPESRKTAALNVVFVFSRPPEKRLPAF